MYLALPRHASAVISFLSFLKQTIAIFIDHLKRIIRMYLVRIVQYIMHNTEEPLGLQIVCGPLSLFLQVY